jgi:hypothetical protein
MFSLSIDREGNAYGCFNYFGWVIKDIWKTNNTNFVADAIYKGLEMVINIAGTPLPASTAGSANPVFISGQADVRGFTYLNPTTRPQSQITIDPTAVTAGYFTPNFTGIDFCEDSPRNVWFIGTQVAIERPQAYRSLNAGLDQIQFRGVPVNISTVPNGQGGGGKIAVSATNPSKAVVVVRNKVAYTDDDGANWRPSAGIPTSETLLQSEIEYEFDQLLKSDRVNGEKYYVVSLAGNFYVSSDGGRNFTRKTGAGLPARTFNSASPPTSGGSGGVHMAVAPGLEEEVWVSMGASGIWRATGAGANKTKRAMNSRDVANWMEPVSYTIYNDWGGSRADFAQKTPAKQGTTAGIDFEVVSGLSSRYTILYAGTLNVPVGGIYHFDLLMSGAAALWIDGSPVIPMTSQNLGKPVSQSVSLGAGSHAVDVLFGWSPRAEPGLELFVSQSDTRPQPLHRTGSKPQITPVAPMLIQPEAQPTLLRSFVQLPSERLKRTHALSVGMHYTLDLNQMALILAWKGDFADMTQVWHERAMPQLLQPAGVLVRPAPGVALAALPNPAAAWPDTLDERTLRYEGLSVDSLGNPTIEYVLAGAAVQDQVRAAANTLTRTLTVGGPPIPALYCRLAAGTTLEEVQKGLYAVDDRSYFVRFDPAAAAIVRQSQGRQELLLPVPRQNDAATVTYSLEF